jgi:hypothetical protein
MTFLISFAEASPAAPMGTIWSSSPCAREGRVWLDELLALDNDMSDPNAMTIRRRALQGAAWLASDQHEYEGAKELFEEGKALQRALGENEDETNPSITTAIQARARGDYSQALALLEAVVAEHRALGIRQSVSSFGVGLSPIRPRETRAR